jgi:hypothetical protein
VDSEDKLKAIALTLLIALIGIGMATAAYVETHRPAAISCPRDCCKAAPPAR